MRYRTQTEIYTDRLKDYMRNNKGILEQVKSAKVNSGEYSKLTIETLNNFLDELTDTPAGKWLKEFDVWYSTLSDEAKKEFDDSMKREFGRRYGQATS